MKFRLQRLTKVEVPPIFPIEIDSRIAEYISVFRLGNTTYQSLFNVGNSFTTFSCTGVMYSNFMSLNAESSAGSSFPCRLLYVGALAAMSEALL